MKWFPLVMFLIFYSFISFSQNYEKIVFNQGDEDGYYLAVPPQSEEVIGVLVLMPGFGQTAESVFPETKIQNVAYANNVLTIVIAGGRKLYADKEVSMRLNEAFKHVCKKYSVKNDDFIIGGFSAGGTISLRYAGYCYESPDKFAISPKGVFSVDSPVDLFNIWDYFQREIKKDYSNAGVGEAKFVTEIMEREIGNPIENKENYDRLTPFDTGLNKYGNERFLQDINVRVYHDVDIVWQLENRRRSLFDSNALASSEMINRPMLMGNQNAAFVVAKEPGYRSTGMRHPHSWSIVDEVELIQWVKGILTDTQ